MALRTSGIVKPKRGSSPLRAVFGEASGGLVDLGAGELCKTIGERGDDVEGEEG